MNRAIIFLGLSIAAVSISGIVAAQQTKPMASAAVKAESSRDDAAFTAWDVDHNGNLSRQEFSTGREQVRRAVQIETRLRRQFIAVDSNKNGGIDPAEYRNLVLVKNAGKSAPPLSSFDASKDGKLQLGEYLKMVRMLISRQTAQDNPR